MRHRWETSRQTENANTILTCCGAHLLDPMKKTEIHIEQGDVLEYLMPFIKGKVFHVSRVSNWQSIRVIGKILPNKNGELKTSFGSSSNSYFKNKGCVSVFDYRNIHEEEPQEHMYKCSPTSPLTPEEGIVIFILKEKFYNKLVLWDGWKQDDLRQMVVPHVEAGFPDAIELSQIGEALFVTMDETESTCVFRILSTPVPSRS